jgi:four helix bundle protein
VAGPLFLVNRSLYFVENMKITRFEEIEGWKLGRELTKMVYAATSKPPFSKDFGLKDQITRASGSVMHNIASPREVKLCTMSMFSNPILTGIFTLAARKIYASACRCTTTGRSLQRKSERRSGSFTTRLAWKSATLITEKNISRRPTASDLLSPAASTTSRGKGFDGGSNAEFVKFLRYAQRSASEVQSQLYVAIDQDYISSEQFDALYTKAQQTHSKIGGFINYLLRSEKK